MSVTREVTWGDALVVEMFKAHGGLKAAVDHIAKVMGKTIGSRNTFAKLLRVDDPSDLNGADLWRAWLLLTAIGRDPQDWGISDAIVPTYIDIPDLSSRLLLPRQESNLQPPGRESKSLRPRHLLTLVAAHAA